MYITFNILFFLSTKSERLCIIALSIPLYYQNNILFTKKRVFWLIYNLDFYLSWKLVLLSFVVCVRDVNEEGLKNCYCSFLHFL